MKVVLFCGGMGMRLRDYSEFVPKPMVQIGYRPILWHVMNYYAHFGHRDFIVCLGYRGDSIKDYFLNYEEALSNDFVLSKGGEDVRLLKTDIHDWRITFVETGTSASIGERLKAVEGHLEGEEMFLANYSDGLTDLHLPDYIEAFRNRDMIASFLAVHSNQSFHVASIDESHLVRSIDPMSVSDLWINGGYFIFRKEIFDYIGEREDLVAEPFQRLIAARGLMGYPYRGFWAAMDTFKDRELLNQMHDAEEAPWELWRSGRRRPRVLRSLGPSRGAEAGGV